MGRPLLLLSFLRGVDLVGQCLQTESRLSSLCLMKIDRDRCNKLTSVENIGELVKTFVQLHPRRMKLPFMLQD